MRRRADHAQTIVGQLHIVAAAQEQIALAVLAHRMTGIDVAPQADIDRRAPRALDVIGPDHEVAAPASGTGREIAPTLRVMAWPSGCQFTRSRECQIGRPG
ncbi:hypothetical protein G6F35_017970 [Rhizopus arrhizus]|nr:hypothetical protein G6F35_017970 [Rhizopus arrhizus]